MARRRPVRHSSQSDGGSNPSGSPSSFAKATEGRPACCARLAMTRANQDTTGAGLDVQAQTRNGGLMRDASMKVVGRLKQTPWARFGRLQRAAARLARNRGQPKGVYRFATHEECAAWTAKQSRG